MAQTTQEPRGFATKQEASQANDDVWRKFRADFQSKPITYGVILVLFGLIVGALLFRYQPDWGEENNNLFSFLTNFATEGLGVLVTIFVVDRFQAHRQREQLKKELLADVKYGTNVDAVRAINLMRLYDEDYGWFSSENSLLTNVNLSGANMQQAKLDGANLQRVMMVSANLQEANLVGANLEKAKLPAVNLQHANLMGANLQEASLWDVNLQNAKLVRANLQLAYLVEANLQDADLSGANLHLAELREAILTRTNLVEANTQAASFDEVVFSAETILPDGSNYDPAKGPEQMDRFTDPNHPDFWQPDWVNEQD